MKDLFDERLLERRALLKAAEEHCARLSAAPSLGAREAPSEALFLDGETSASRRLTAQSAASSAESEPGDPPGASLHAGAQPRSRAVWFFAAAAAAAVAALTLLGGHALMAGAERATPNVGVKVSGASAPAARLSADRAAAAMEVRPSPLAPPGDLFVATRSAPAASPTPSGPRPAASVVRENERSTHRSDRPHPRSAPASPRSATSPPPAKKPTPPPSEARKAPVDPWDPSTYGGRF